MEPNTLIIYHNKCRDGLCAAWLLLKVYPGSELVGADYGDDPPDVEGREVFVVDFSYPRDVLLAMKRSASSLLVFDHHKSAAEQLAGLDFCIFDEAKSGAGLVLHWIREKGFGRGWLGVDWVVEYVQDRDLWLNREPHSASINAYIRSFELSIESFEAISNAGITEARSTGRRIQDYRLRIAREHLESSFRTFVDGYIVPVVYCSDPDLISDVGAMLALDEAFSVCYMMKVGQVKYSLRSDENGLDVSKIAEAFGGGGHARAAGFKLKLDDPRNIVRISFDEAHANDSE